MTATYRLSPKRWKQLRASPLVSHVDAFEQYLDAQQYAAATSKTYLRCLAHVGYWMMCCQLVPEDLDEDRVEQFLNDHLPQCDCPAPVCRARPDLQAALGHLLDVLRTRGVIPEWVPNKTPVDVELCRFDAYMDHVRGLASETRRFYLHVVGRLLREQFDTGPIDVATITPQVLRRFVAKQSELYRTSGGVAKLISALRGFLRFRTTEGDRVQTLLGALISPPNWQHSTLPQALRPDEVERLVSSLDTEGPSARRAAAIVRCALDLGLRRAEIAGLSLDDIDWQAGTIRLRHTKGQREDMLPLPETTGQAIAEYLRLERPQTASRAVFVRQIAPHDRPYGPHGVGKTIRQAYARAGLPHTRAHLLRHTLADRLLASGSSLKDVADVLRHRSLNTTLIYAKLDTNRLMDVALPWPGGAQ
jgi:integrase/recombinase XerC